MEQEYSVGTTNRYAMFLDEEDDPGDVVVSSSAKPEKDASSKGTKEKGGSKPQGKGTKGKENKERIAKEQQSKKAAIENAAKGKCDTTTRGRVVGCSTCAWGNSLEGGKLMLSVNIHTLSIAIVYTNA
jgi:hypothetical protein